jgi:hypothetical protein
MSHDNSLLIAESEFSNNSGLKGIINIERKFDSSKSFLIYGNTFKENSGLIDSNVISFRALTNEIGLTNAKFFYPSHCGGIQI